MGGEERVGQWSRVGRGITRERGVGLGSRGMREGKEGPHEGLSWADRDGFRSLYM